MFRNSKKNFGFSVIEVIISALLFSIAAVGVITMTSVIRPKATTTEKEIGAAKLAQATLHKWRQYVDASTWDDADHPLQPGNGTIQNGIYNISYSITLDPDTGGRLVSMTVTWED